MAATESAPVAIGQIEAKWEQVLKSRGKPVAHSLTWDVTGLVRAWVQGKVPNVTGPGFYVTMTDGLEEIDPAFWTFSVTCRDDAFGDGVQDGFGYYLPFKMNRVQFEVISDFLAGDSTLYADSSSHRVGINTQSPDSTLHVVGSGYFTGNVLIDGTLDATLAITALPSFSAYQIDAGQTGIANNTWTKLTFTVEDFDTDADYLREVAKQMRDEIRADADTVARKQQLNATQTQISESYVKARVKYADFDDVALNPELPITQSMFDAALGDNVGDILHHLGKHPDIATRISSLSPIQQAKEIGKIEDRLSKPVPSKKKTNAPDPPIILGSGGSPASKSEAEMNRDELHAKWDAERRKSLGVK